jgi:MYXO-CTERM domain-containing protein
MARQECKLTEARQTVGHLQDVLDDMQKMLTTTEDVGHAVQKAASSPLPWVVAIGAGVALGVGLAWLVRRRAQPSW